MIFNYDLVNIADHAGWTRESTKKYIIENSGIEDWTEDQLLIVVAGGPPGEKNMLVPTWGGSIGHAQIELPSNWNKLVPNPIEPMK